MNKILSYLKGEPVRLRLYAAVLAVAGYALAKGYVNPTDVEFIGTIAALVLGVETARAKVTPYNPEHRAD